MKWQTIKNERSSLQEFQLFDKSDCSVILKYNPLHHSVRLTSGNNHSLYFFETAGSLSGKTIIRTQYGMEVGFLLHDKFHPQEGNLVINKKKYQYKISSVTSELLIFENNLQNLLTTCSLPIINNQTIECNCYLLGICWYLQLPLVKADTLEYAVAAY